MAPSLEHQTHLCHPNTELVTFKASRRQYPPIRIPTTVIMVRKRRVIHALFGILIGFLMGLLINHGVFINWRNYNIKTCPMESWSLSKSSPGKDDPLGIINMTSSETIHNSRRSLLFVGVMTAQKYLATRAVAVYETWGRELPGRIAFFSSSVSSPPLNKPDLPLVRLNGVDDSYPPQKKSFLMLQYMWEQYGDKFEWFLRADDDTYVRPDKLERFLRSVDSRKAQFIGQAGRGNQEEFGLLSLEYDENFCMGGPGIIMSRETLARVVPHIKYCLKNLYTTHEDVELGRCVQKFAGIPCTWSYEMQSIMYHNSSGSDAFTGKLKQKEIHRAITLHPIKQHKHMYRVHNYMKVLKIQSLQQQAVTLHRDVAAMAAMLGLQPEELTVGNNEPLFPEEKGSQQYLGDTAMLGLPPGLNKEKPGDKSEVLEWDFIARSIFSHRNSNPRRRIESPLREGLDDVIREVMDMINMFSKQRGRVIEYREILYGYQRVSPQYGADYILDLLLVYKKYRGRKMTVPVRRHVYLQQQFTGLEIRETFEGMEVQSPESVHVGVPITENIPDHFQNTIKNAFQKGFVKISENFPPLLKRPPKTKPFNINDKTINFILPLSGRYKTFLRFVNVFEEVCLGNSEKVTLTVVLFSSKLESTFNQSLNTIKTLQTRYPGTVIHTISTHEPFARAKALELGASKFTNFPDLLFFVDVDMVFTTEALQRIRTNTILGKQAYFPIVYSEYDPSIVYDDGQKSDNFNIDEDSGYWRQFGFGIASIYSTDLRTVGGFNTTIQGWGREDVDLYDKIVTSANLKVFRSPDPGLVHVFHIVECDPLLEAVQLKMCKGTRVDTYGGVRQLAEFMYNHRDIFEYARNKNKGPS